MPYLNPKLDATNTTHGNSMQSLIPGLSSMNTISNPALTSALNSGHTENGKSKTNTQPITTENLTTDLGIKHTSDDFSALHTHLTLT